MRGSNIVILGAGVAGLRVAQRLNKRLSPGEAKVTVIDQNVYHQLLYKLHEVCNKDYDEKEIIVPIECLIKGSVEFRQATVESVDMKLKIVKTQDDDAPYDILVLALGSHTAYFNIDGLKVHSSTLASYGDAKRIRGRIKALFDEAEKTGKAPEIVIGGGGFTGVELAGEIADWLPSLYESHGLKRPETLVTIVEAMSSLLPGWDPKLVEGAQGFLMKRGVRLQLNDPVVRVDEKQLLLKSGLVLQPDLFIWTGGVEVDPACGGDLKKMSRRLVVDEYLRYEGADGVFVAGDSACTLNLDGKPMPPNAHIAMMQADVVTHNILSTLRGGDLKAYTFNHAGEVVTLGRTHAVGELFGVRITGLPARVMKRFIHLWYLHSIGGFKLLLKHL